MGIVALVEGADVVVEEVGTVAQTAEGVANAVGEVVSRGLDEAAVPLVPRQIREHAHTEGIFAVRGRVGKGRVVIVEQEALVRQLVEGRRQILCNENRGIGLTAELNQIAPLEIARVAVLRGSLRIAEILVQGLDALVIGIGVQILKVDGKDVFCIGRCYGAAFHILHLRQTGNDELIVLVVVLRREEELTGLQPHRRHHAQAVDAFVRDDGAAVIGAEGSVPLRAAQTQGENAARPKQYDQPNENQVEVADAFAEGLRHVLGAQNVEHNGDREDEYLPPGAQDRDRRFLPETGHGSSAELDHFDREEAAEHAMIDDLRRENHHQKDGQPQSQAAVNALAAQAGQIGKDQRTEGGEGNDVQRACREALVANEMTAEFPDQKGDEPVAEIVQVFSTPVDSWDLQSFDRFNHRIRSRRSRRF